MKKILLEVVLPDNWVYEENETAKIIFDVLSLSSVTDGITSVEVLGESSTDDHDSPDDDLDYEDWSDDEDDIFSEDEEDEDEEMFQFDL